MQPKHYAELFINNIDNKKRISDIYDEWIKELANSGIWSPDNLDSNKIQWESAKDAYNYFKSSMDSPGIYIFITKLGLPRYIGKTENQSLKKRLFSRYLCYKNAQCKLAKEYGNDLIERGLDGFPNEIMDWYRKNYGNSNVRLIGAIDFAKNDINKICFSFIPIGDKKLIGSLEKLLIEIGCYWNSKNNLPQLLNKQEVK